MQQSRFGFLDNQKVRFGVQPLKRLRMMFRNRSRSQLKLNKSSQELPGSGVGSGVGSGEGSGSSGVCDAKYASAARIASGIWIRPQP